MPADNATFFIIEEIVLGCVKRLKDKAMLKRVAKDSPYPAARLSALKNPLMDDNDTFNTVLYCDKFRKMWLVAVERTTDPGLLSSVLLQIARGEGYRHWKDSVDDVGIGALKNKHLEDTDAIEELAFSGHSSPKLRLEALRMLKSVRGQRMLTIVLGYDPEEGIRLEAVRLCERREALEKAMEKDTSERVKEAIEKRLAELDK